MKPNLLFRIFYDTGAQVAGRILSGLLAFLTTVVLARMLGGSGYGEYTKILTYLAFFYILSDFGLNAIFLRDYGSRMRTEFAAFLGLRLAGSTILAVLAVVLMLIIRFVVPGWSDVLGGVAIGSLSIIGFGLFVTVSAVFQMRKRFDRMAFAQITGAATALGLLFMAAKVFTLNSTHGVLVAMTVVVTGWWVTAVAGFILFPQPVSFVPGFNRQQWRNIFLRSLPLGLTLVLNTMYFRADTLILAIYKTSQEVGAYGLAYKFFEVALILPTFIMNSLYPELLKAQMDEAQIRRRFYSLGKIFFVLSLVVAAAAWVLAPFLLYVKADFADSIIYLRLLSVSLPFFYLSSPLMWFYILLQNQGKLVIVYGLSLVFNIVVNAVFVPRFGATAAAITTGLTEAVVLVSGLYFFRKK